MLTPRPQYKENLPIYLPSTKGQPIERGKDIPTIQEPISIKKKVWFS